MSSPLQCLVDAHQLTSQAKILNKLPSDTNQCWLVRDDGHDTENSLWVVKKLRFDSLSVDWDQLVNNTLQAEAANLTPLLTYADTHAGYLLMPYREAHNLLQSGWSKQEKITFLAKVASSIHMSPLQFKPMDLYEEVKGYIQRLENSAAKETFLSELLNLPDLQQQTVLMEQTLVPAHMDLSFSNILVNGEILDWEYARQTLPVVELAFSATINKLTDSESRYLFDCYSELQNRNESFESFEIYRLWSQLLNRIWYHVANEATSF